MTRLQPTAGPIDAFAPAEVRSTQDLRLSSLAQGLSQFSSGLAAFSDAYLSRQKELGYAEAQKEHLQRQLKSVDDFEAAVKRGDIRASDNPWKMVFMRQLVARDQVRSGLLQLEQEFQSSEDEQIATVRNSHSVDALEGWVSSRVSGLTQGLDPFTATAVSDQIDRWKGGFLSSRASEWEQQREQASSLAVSRSLFDVLGRSVLAEAAGPVEPGAPAPTSSVGYADAQRVIDNALKVSNDPEAVRRAAMNAVAAIAEARKDGDYVDRALSQVKVNGKTLGELALPGEVVKIKEGVDDALYRDLHRKVFLDQQNQKQAVDFELARFNARLRQATEAGDQAGVFIDPNTVIGDGISQLHPEVQVKLRQIEDGLIAEALQGQAAKQIAAAGGIGSPKAMSVVERLVSLGHPTGAQAAAEVSKWRKFVEDNRFPTESNLDALAQVNDIVNSADPPAQRMAALTSLIRAGQISYKDATAAQASILQSGTVGKERFDELKNNFASMLEAQHYGQALAAMEGTADFSSLNPFEKDYSNQIARTQADVEKQKLLIDATRWYSQHPKATIAEAEQWFAKRMEQTLGPPPDPKVKETQRVTQQIVSNPLQAVLDGQAKLQDGKLTFKTPDGTKTIAAPKMFTDPKAELLNGKWEKMDPEIVKSQVGYFSQDTAAALSNEVNSKRHGPEVVTQAADTRKLVSDTIGRINHIRELGGQKAGSLFMQTDIGYLKTPDPVALKAMSGAASELQSMYSNLFSLPQGQADVAAAQAAITKAEQLLQSLVYSPVGQPDVTNAYTQQQIRKLRGNTLYGRIRSLFADDRSGGTSR